MYKFHLHTDKYLDAIYDKKLNLVEYYWKKATEEITEAEYRMIVFDITEAVLERVHEGKWRAPNWLLDNRNFLYVMSPKLQRWQAENIFAKINDIGTKKIAVLTSENVVSQMSIEQSFEENNYLNIRTQYFYNHEQATDWLQE
ncbi:hypothetical protein BKI52_42865 [marine bacterium AO1-C]|nr:hypothetical protein BKI52_42865 [marine bacterium AO1-C]